MRRSFALACLIGALLALPVLALASGRYDPRLRFRTVSTPRFDIHFHQGEEAEARRLAAIAEDVARRLDGTLGAPSGRVQVILVAQNDFANGWATPLPYNTIELTATTPGADSTIGNTSDWLRMVFTHEYTHVVHLSRGRGWIGGLRRVFGRMPLLYPNLYLPIWQIEGIATYEESVLTGQGRVNDGSFRAILDVAAGQSRFETLDRASGGLVEWPGGHAPYLYGSLFHQFLADRYGEASVRELTDATAGRVPYFGAPAFTRVFGRSLGELWEDFEAVSPRSIDRLDATRLTRHGFNVLGPRFGPDGAIYYSVVNPHGFPALLALREGEPRPRKVAGRYLGGAIALTGTTLVFDQLDVQNQVGLQSDLYAVGTDGRAARRLTTGARASDPDLSPDGQTIVCAIQREDRRELATLPLRADGSVGDLVTLLSEPGVSYASPRWSPDGKSIAAERRFGEIVIVDTIARRIVRSLTAESGRMVTPSWTLDGALLFSSDRGRRGFRVYRADIGAREVLRLDGTGADARSPESSPDGGSIVFVGYTADGYDLFRVPNDRSRWTGIEPDAFRWNPVGAPDVDRLASAPPTMDAPAAYSPWRTLAPRFWMPIVESDNEELVFGAGTGSADALGRHAYSARAGWTISRGRPDWQVAYVYDRWWPTLFANASDDTDPWRGGELRTREVNAGALLPFRRVRWSQAVLGSLHSSTDDLICADCDAPSTTIRRRAVRGGWRVNAARGYGYSISAEDGWSATVTTELTREALGSEGDGGAATADLRGYVPVVPRHAVVALRVAGATTWGSDRVRRVFSASGHGPQPGGFRFGSDAIGLLRGVADDEIVGTHATVANIDYRFPLMRLDRGAGTLPVFARVLHGAIFADVGHAWTGTFKRGDVTYSLGAELSLDAVWGYALPITFSTGAAWVSHDRGVTAFGRIGRGF